MNLVVRFGHQAIDLVRIARIADVGADPDQGRPDTIRVTLNIDGPVDVQFQGDEAAEFRKYFLSLPTWDALAEAAAPEVAPMTTVDPQAPQSVPRGLIHSPSLGLGRGQVRQAPAIEKTG